MADLQNFTVVRNTSISFSIPRFNITASFTDTKRSSVVRGTLNGVFPSAAFSAQFTAQEMEDAYREMVTNLILKKAAAL